MITIIGAITGEIIGSFDGQPMADHNPGTIDISYSGTGRNIAENLGRMGSDVAFISATGNDFAGRSAKRELGELSINTEYLCLVDGQNTAMNVQLLNMVGDLEMDIRNQDVFAFIDKKVVDSGKSVIDNSDMIAIDGNLSEEVIKYIVQTVDKPLFFDPTSTEGAKKAKDIIGKFHTIKPNREEAEALFGSEILSEDQLMAAGQWFSDQGVKRIFITMSGGGVYYREGITAGIIRPENILSFENQIGAGDGFSAALLDGYTKGMDVESLAKYGMAASAVAMEIRNAVNPRMSTAEFK
ncbi:MAG: PfkB family carbohydrate kinase [Anaerovoracaceae bacterium]